MSYRVFDRLYERYDSWYHRHPGLAASELAAVRRALRGAPRPCLEVGVGTGWFASRLGCELGVDPSIGMLRLAAARGVMAVQGRGEALPFASSSIGTVLIVVTLCFADDPAGLLAEARRVLRPGGRLVACIVPRETPWGRHYVLQALRGHPFYRYARFLTARQLLSLAEQAGFRVEELVASIRYPPWGREHREPPTRYRGREGFLCLVAGR